MPMMNRQWRLRSRPPGMPTRDTWYMSEVPVPEPGDGEVLARACWLSVDPYMRGRISAGPSYARPVEPGDVMQGGGVGVVVASRNPALRPGDVVESMGWGWQDYALLPPLGTRKVDLSLGPMRQALGVLGMPGLTAYFALLDVGAPRPGDVVAVSSASGAVGQVVGQIAKLMGCRTVAIAGGPEKLAWCRELGYDAGVDYKAGDLRAALADATPDGIDVYFDNTAGPDLRRSDGAHQSARAHRPVRNDRHIQPPGTAGCRPAPSSPDAGQARALAGFPLHRLRPS
jgi:NADPH-dependent curcumin reductase CurA